MHPTFQDLTGLLSENLFSKFLPRFAQSQERFLVILSCQFDEFLIVLLEKSDGAQSVPQKVLLAL